MTSHNERDDFPCCAPERKPTKKEQIAELTRRVEVLSKDLTIQHERHGAELAARDRVLAVAGFVRAEHITELIVEADPWHVSYSAKIHMSEGAYQGLCEREGRNT